MSEYDDFMAALAEEEARTEGVEVAAETPPPKPAPAETEPQDTTIPPSVYENPGRLIRGIMDYTLSVSPHPNEPLALAGAIALMSLLCGRRFRTETNLRSNLYIIGLGESGIGKEAARQTNKTILSDLEMWDHCADTFGSGEGLEDALLCHARLLFQYDEIDTLFASIKNDRTGSRESVSQKILNLNGVAGGYLSRRKLSGKAKDDSKVPSKVYHPSLTIYGTAVTSAFGAQITQKMQTNGFFGRCLIIDGGVRAQRNKLCKWAPVPDDLIADLKTVAGYSDVPDLWNENKPDWSDTGILVVLSAEAQVVLDSEYEREERIHHLPTTSDGEKTMYGRVLEKITKLALIHSISREPLQSIYTILPEDILWARDIVWPATAYSLRLLGLYAAENDAEADRKKIKQIIAKSCGAVERSYLIRYAHLSSTNLDEALTTLIEAEEVVEVFAPPAANGKCKRTYAKGRYFDGE